MYSKSENLKAKAKATKSLKILLDQDTLPEYETVIKLIKQGADPYVFNKYGFNFLHRVCQLSLETSTVLDAIEVIQKSKPGEKDLPSYDVTIKTNREPKQTPLEIYLARPTLQSEVVIILLKAGADPKTLYKGLNCLHIAVQKKWSSAVLIELIELMRNNIEQLSIPRGRHKIIQNGETALSFYLDSSPINIEVFKAFVDAGASVNTINKRGDNYLHIALEQKIPKEELLQIIGLGFDPKIKNSEGKTAQALYKANYQESFDPSIFNALAPTKQKSVEKSTNTPQRPGAAASYSSQKRPVSLFNQPTSRGQEIYELLTKGNPDPSQIKQLGKEAKGKEAVIEYIRTLEPSKRKPSLDQALNNRTNLGKFFAVQRSFRQVSPTRGSLLTLHQMLRDVVRKEIEKSESRKKYPSLFGDKSPKVASEKGKEKEEGKEEKRPLFDP